MPSKSSDSSLHELGNESLTKSKSFDPEKARFWLTQARPDDLYVVRIHERDDVKTCTFNFTHDWQNQDYVVIEPQVFSEQPVDLEHALDLTVPSNKHLGHIDIYSDAHLSIETKTGLLTAQHLDVKVRSIKGRLPLLRTEKGVRLQLVESSADHAISVDADPVTIAPNKGNLKVILLRYPASGGHISTANGNVDVTLYGNAPENAGPLLVESRGSGSVIFCSKPDADGKVYDGKWLEDSKEQTRRSGDGQSKAPTADHSLSGNKTSLR